MSKDNDNPNDDKSSFEEKKFLAEIGFKQVIIITIITAIIAPLTIAVTQFILVRPTAPPTPAPSATITLPTFKLVPALITETPTQSIPRTTTPPTQTQIPLGWTQIAVKDGMVLIYVSAGDFKMGKSNSGRIEENPEHDVYLDPFFIDKIEITNAMYARCVADGKCPKPFTGHSATRANYYNNAQYASYPIISINWDEARLYCEWAGRRLPTEAEWEKAARGNTNNFYPWGNVMADKGFVNFGKSYSDTTQVGIFSYGASPYGVLDMAGNVAEWTADYFDPAYYQSSPRNNPKGPTSGLLRAVRGGGWDNDEYGIRVTTRNSANPLERLYTIGFRCAQSVP